MSGPASRSLATLILTALLTLSACATGVAPPAPPRPLSADSLALLEEAVRRARPAYRTQAEALRAGVYSERAPVPTPAEERLLGRPAEESEPRGAPEVARAPGGPFVIQIGAFPERSAAEAEAARARRLLGEVEISYEWAGEFLRVAVGGWPSMAEAERRLPEVRRVYPDAWARRRSER